MQCTESIQSRLIHLLTAHAGVFFISEPGPLFENNDKIIK